MRRKTWITLGSGAGLALLAAGFFTGRALASGIPSTGALVYSGYLEESSGAPLAGTTVTVRVSVFDAASAGTEVCRFGPSSTTLDNGRFAVALPDECTTAVKGSPNLWAEVAAGGTNFPRSKLNAVPYAIEASHATTADTATSATTATDMAPTGGLASAIAQMQSDIAALKDNFGSSYNYDSSITTVSSATWTWVSGTPSLDMKAGERVFVWNTGSINPAQTALGGTCSGTCSYATARLAACWIANGDTANPTVSGQVTLAEGGSAECGAGCTVVNEATVVDYFQFAAATTGVQIGLCASRNNASAGVYDFAVRAVNTIAIRAPVHP